MPPILHRWTPRVSTSAVWHAIHQQSFCAIFEAGELAIAVALVDLRCCAGLSARVSAGSLRQVIGDGLPVSNGTSDELVRVVTNEAQSGLRPVNHIH